MRLEAMADEVSGGILDGGVAGICAAVSAFIDEAIACVLV